MDEEDGRPGAVALQCGHLNAQTDVPKASLSHPNPIIFGTVILSENANAGCPRSGFSDLGYLSPSPPRRNHSFVT